MKNNHFHKNYNRNAENAVMVLVASYIFLDESDINKHIAQHTLRFVSKIPQMTVDEMASICDVSVSSYLRFCRAIGYESFTDFKLHVASSLRKYTHIGSTPIAEHFSPDNFFQLYRDYILQDFNHLEQLLSPKTCLDVVKSLSLAENIYMVDLFYSTIRFALHGDLAVSGKNIVFAQPSDDLGERLKKEKSENCLIFLFLDGTYRTENFCAALPHLKNMGAHITVLSCSKHFSGQEYCDEILYTGIPSSPVSAIMIHDLALHYLSVLYKNFCLCQDCFDV